MSGQAPVLAESWARLVSRDGFAEIATLSQAQLLAAGVTMISPAETTGDHLQSTFDGLSDEDKARAVGAARTADVSDDALSLVSGVSNDPTFRGTWMQTPAWFEGLERSRLVRLYGMDLPDGTAGVLEANVNLTSSRFTYHVRTLSDAARALAAQFFAAEPEAPPDAEPGWTEATGGGLAQMQLVWPHNRATRAVTWRVTRTTGDSTQAFVQGRRDHGARRSFDASEDEAGLRERLLRTLTQVSDQGHRRG
jgi:HAMP domain-containing protein